MNTTPCQPGPATETYYRRLHDRYPTSFGIWLLYMAAKFRVTGLNPGTIRHTI